MPVKHSHVRVSTDYQSAERKATIHVGNGYNFNILRNRLTEQELMRSLKESA